MNNYVIVTDSSCDLNSAMKQELDVTAYPLTFTMDGVTRPDYSDQSEISLKEFYTALRDGSMSSTAAVNISDYTTGLEPILAAGKDVLILAFSSGLSATCQSAVMAAQELSEQFPQRKIYVVDTLCASMGLGLLVWHAVKHQREGMSLEDLRDWAESAKGNVSHQITVADLGFLKRGVRVSGATAVVGTMLSIKPLLHITDEGGLVKCGTARGRAGSLKALVEATAKTITDTAAICVVHGDCEEEALTIKANLAAHFPDTEILVNIAGPVIGSHAGPDFLGVFFMGSQR